MKNTVDELVQWVSTSSPYERDRIRSHIETLDAIDSRFSSVALRLFTEPRPNPSIEYVTSMLRSWITDSATMESAHRIAERRQHQFGMEYNAPLVVLEGAAAAHAVATMVIPQQYSAPTMIRDAADGDFSITAGPQVITRPDLMTASHEELNRYYRPLAVSGILLDIQYNQQRFMDEAPAFLTWVTAQPNLDELLAAALHAKSLEPGTIKALAAMKKATPAPLHDGLI